ncbi:MAG: AAA family ATPase [Planctomyces sp.]|nr:AAA family ATPase [Planctomyces sp.]
MSTAAPRDSILDRLGKMPVSGDSGIMYPARRPAIPPAAATLTKPAVAPSDRKPDQPFYPVAPRTLEEAGLIESEVSSLLLKKLLNRSVEAGFRLADQLGLRMAIIEPVLRQLKTERLVAYKTTLSAGDYIYELTDLGRDRAREFSSSCSYFGTAPVPLSQYISSVAAQSIAHRRPSLAAIRHAFRDLSINERLLSNVAQAIHSGRGMFLFGNAGNGKTSIAERLTQAYGDSIWIPRAISAHGEILRLFDPNRHQPVAVDPTDLPESIDGRWLKIRRPTVMAGGELRMENLEVTYIRSTGIGEAPLQLKANCGTLLIDDFGRQRMPVDELLNRWIVPLEQRQDFLHLESGRTIQTPFDQLIIFSTNLEPRDLVEEAFLRRIPYKIEVKDPTEQDFVALFETVAGQMKIECPRPVIEYLFEKHYRTTGRSPRYCHPRDLLRQIENRCTVHDLPRVATEDAIDQAVENYFSVL